MSIIYVLLSPTFGMHQYTADLANRMADGSWWAGKGHGTVTTSTTQDRPHEVHLVTTTTLRRDRYSPAVQIHTPITTRGTGFTPEGLDVAGLRRVLGTIEGLADHAGGSICHFTGVHLWNPLLMAALRRRGIRVVHTLHDLDPHRGVPFARLIRLWNRLVIAQADHILVHGRRYRQRLIAQGVAPTRITTTPLLHLFLSFNQFAQLNDGAVEYEPWSLFFGRLEAYKGVPQLLRALSLLETSHRLRLVLAGPGQLDRLWSRPLPSGVELRNRLIEDGEAVDLFRRCGLLVFPYLDATQSALIAAAYYFRKPVLVTRAGALPEYVQEGETGWIVSPNDGPALAESLREALSDPNRLAEMGSAGRRWYERQRQEEQAVLLAMVRQLGK